MYQERYPLQAAEARAQSLWTGHIWPEPSVATVQQAVLADIHARLTGVTPINGTPALLPLGVLIPTHAPMPTDLFQGADAFRLGCILSQKTQTCPPDSCWRLVHQIARKLSGVEPFSQDVITMYIHPQPKEALIIKSLKNNDFYQVLSLVRSGLSESLSAAQKSFYAAVLYPIVPHVILFVAPFVADQAPAFYHWLCAQSLPLPVLVNHKHSGWWWPCEIASEEQLEKEVLSLSSVSNKIKGRSVRHIIYIKERVVHVLV